MGWASKREDEIERADASGKPFRSRYSLSLFELPGKWAEPTVRINRKAWRELAEAVARLDEHNSLPHDDGPWKSRIAWLVKGSQLHHHLVKVMTRFAVTFPISSWRRAEYLQIAERMRKQRLADE